jgi:hypothetical protein
MPFSKGAILDEKISSYLLNRRHPIGWPKGRFLLSIGFSDTRLEDIAAALLAQARAGSLSKIHTIYGQKLIVNGPIVAPTGTIAQIRTIWYIRASETIPRLVSFKPLRKA